MDRDQFWQHLEPIHPEAEAFCRKLAGSRDEGDDLYQDALLTALRKLSTLRRSESFRPWLYRIIVNCFRNRRRDPWWRRRVLLAEDQETAGRVADPSRQYAARNLLERAFRVLTPQEKALVILFELEEWSIAELTDLYQSRAGTIKSRLSRARHKMRRELMRYQSRPRTANLISEGRYAMPGSETSTE